MHSTAGSSADTETSIAEERPPTEKVDVKFPEPIVDRLDHMVHRGRFTSRAEAIKYIINLYFDARVSVEAGDDHDDRDGSIGARLSFGPEVPGPDVPSGSRYDTKQVTVKLPEPLLDRVEGLVRSGRVANRSAAFRYIINLYFDERLKAFSS